MISPHFEDFTETCTLFMVVIITYIICEGPKLDA